MSRILPLGVQKKTVSLDFSKKSLNFRSDSLRAVSTAFLAVTSLKSPKAPTVPVLRRIGERLISQ
ncbi:MAG: hypothetical protein BWY86_01242 [Candidatus Aminicenantes bacterium ADurb.Bin508]|nr:MAG: hypothetical protein BWY86_01242 [Candidatus Aminicenantes bacterium ADurb.Bin508]